MKRFIADSVFFNEEVRPTVHASGVRQDEKGKKYSGRNGVAGGGQRERGVEKRW